MPVAEAPTLKTLHLVITQCNGRKIALRILFLFSFNHYSTFMTLHPKDFPITIQAFDISDNKEFFVAEQIVNSQSEVETFSARYAGKVIKAKALSATERTTTVTKTQTRKNSGLTTFLVILVILIILVAIGFYTGWIQRTTGISLGGM